MIHALKVEMLSRPTGRKPKKSGGVTHKNMLVRMPVELIEKIDSFSRAAYRSKTAEVVARLLESYEGQSIDAHGVIVEQRSRFAK